MENGSNIELFSRCYCLLVMIWFALSAFYYVMYWLRGKYALDKAKLKRVVYNWGLCFGVIQVIGAIAILFTPVNYVEGVINCSDHLVNSFILFYLLIEFIVLLFGDKKIEKHTYINLVIIFIIQLLAVFLGGCSPQLPYLNIGIILVVFYTYFTLENIERQELRDMTLERDYAKKQSIDKHDFLRVLSHEIRTPLNTIDGFSQVIMDSDSLEEIKGDVEDIRVASRELIDVINGMIDLAILESGKLEVIEENYNVYDMFEDIKAIALSKMKDKDVVLKTEIDNDIPEVLLGDSERFSQVILNLLTNAIKYTDKGEITLKVDSVKSSSRCRLKVIVSDTGKGIKKEELGMLFEYEPSKEGGALGLAISKYLVELMGGSIEVESTYGTGSTFIVTLDQKIISDVVEEKGTRKRALKPFKATGKRILLVDDNKLNLKVAMKLLQPYEMEVISASSGRECLNILDKDTNFDLILMDDLMPEMSGTECLDILKKLERVDGYYIPVVVLTANAVSGMKEKYLNVGFEDYLAKPIDKYELDRILKKYLKGKK